MKPDRLTLMSITVFGAAMIALSACSAGSGSTVAAGSGSAGGAAAGGSASSNAIFGLTGKPIVVADISDLTGIPGFDPSGFAAGARAAASYINAQGGIDGRPIQVTSCDDAMNPGASSACAQKAVAAGAVAVTGVNNVATSGQNDILSKANIVSMQYPDEPSEFSDPDWFPLGGGGPAEYTGLGYYFGHYLHANSIAQMLDDAGFARTTSAEVDAGAKAGGTSHDSITYFASGTTDFTAATSKVASSSPDAVMVQVNGNQVAVVYSLLEQQGIPASKIYNFGGALDAPVLKAAGQATVGASFVSEFANFDDTSNPQVRTYTSAMQKYGEGSYTRTLLGEWGFANVMFVATVAKAIGAANVTGPSVKSYLTKQLAPGAKASIPVFLGAPMGAPSAQYPALHRTSIELVRWNGSKFITESPFFSVPAVPAG